MSSARLDFVGRHVTLELFACNGVPRNSCCTVLSSLWKPRSTGLTLAALWVVSGRAFGWFGSLLGGLRTLVGGFRTCFWVVWEPSGWSQDGPGSKRAKTIFTNSRSTALWRTLLVMKIPLIIGIMYYSIIYQYQQYIPKMDGGSQNMVGWPAGRPDFSRKRAARILSADPPGSPSSSSACSGSRAR